MNNRIEQFVWPPFLPERFNPYRDLKARDIEGFLKLVGKEKPSEVIATVLLRGITFDGIFTADRKMPDSYEAYTEFTAPIPVHGYRRSLVYSEHYSNGFINPDEYTDETTRAKFIASTQLAAINRLAKIKAASPFVRIALNAFEGQEELSKEAIENIRQFARENHLSPLLI